jgi:mono/diheme cytochrome c family protein
MPEFPMPIRPWIRHTALATAALLSLAAAGAATAVWLGHRKLDRQVPTPPLTDWAVPSDAAAVTRGAYLYASRGCADCHGANGAGRAFINDPNGFYLKAPNISPGPGSVTTSYRAQDWTRLLRHGVKPDGRPAFIMPSEDYARWTQDDLAALVAYVRQLPPVAGGGLEKRVPAPVMALYGLGAIPDAAEKIGPGPAQPAQPVAAAISLEHGAYVAQMCVGCHGAQLQGGRIPGGPPDWPAAAALSGAQSVMARYPDADSFLRMLRSGQRADGTAVQVMPFETLKNLDDTDARALHLYLSRKS